MPPLDFSPIGNLGTQMQNLAVEARQMRHQGIQDQALLQNMAQQNYQFEQQKKKQERADKPMYLDEFKHLFENNPAEGQLLMKLGQPYLQTDPVGKQYIRSEDARTVWSTLQSDKNIAHDYQMAVFQDTTSAIDKINAKMQEVQGSGEPNEKSQKELAGLMKQKQDLDTKRALMLKTLTPKTQNVQHIVIPDKNSETGFSYMNPNDKSIIATAPTPASAQPRTKSSEMLVEEDLKQRLGRQPTAGEIRDELKKEKVDVARAGAQVRNDVSTAQKEKEGFGTWTPEAKKQSFMEHMIMNTPPVSVRGFSGSNRNRYDKEYQQWKVDTGFTPQMVAAMRASYKANDKSLSNMTKQEGPMTAFVKNINQQVDYAETLFKDLQRTDTRLLNIPLRELRTRVKGSGLERTYELFMNEISMEANKLAAGSSASIAQIPEGNRKEWTRIHDINLPLSEIMPVLKGTKKMANMRLSTWAEAKQNVLDSIMGMAPEQSAPAAPAGNTAQPPKKVGRFTIEVE